MASHQEPNAFTETASLLMAPGKNTLKQYDGTLLFAGLPASGCEFIILTTLK